MSELSAEAEAARARVLAKHGEDNVYVQGRPDSCVIRHRDGTFLSRNVDCLAKEQEPIDEDAAWIDADRRQNEAPAAAKRVEGELPPLGNPWRADIRTGILPEQRAKWKKMWAKMDEDECEKHRYKHYEWECRKAFEELERRERQLSEALPTITDLREQLAAAEAKGTREQGLREAVDAMQSVPGRDNDRWGGITTAYESAIISRIPESEG